MGPLELGLIVLLGVLLFGASRLPKVGRGLGEATKAWRTETEDTDQ